MKFTRREMIIGTGGVVTAVALGGCESLLESIRNRPVRRDISTMSPSDPTLLAFQDAVAQMKALPSSDPRNWTKQAEIHYNYCPHGNWFFLPWHRAYLLSFERICQELLGDSDFGLPYWNWSCNRSVPAPFWVSGSSLFHSPRTATSSSVADNSIVGPMAMQSVLSETDFELFASGYATALRGAGGFYGKLENPPHNYIHGFVGGTMGTFMSPLDPVFWCHHNIIDYFWYEWNNMGNANTNDPIWTNFDIAGQMVDGSGNPVTYRVGTLILAPLLSYRFDPPAPCGPLTFSLAEARGLRRLLEEGRNIRFNPIQEFQPSASVRITGAQRTRTQIPIPLEAVTTASRTMNEERLLLRINNVEAPMEEDFFVQVYLNLPDGEEPSTNSPSYAGSFAFFTDQSMQQMRHNFVVDMTDAVERLNRAGRLGGAAASVTLVPVPVEPGRPVRQAVTIGSLTPIMIEKLPPAEAPR